MLDQLLISTHIMEKPTSLSVVDATAIIRLLGEVAALESDLMTQKRSLLDGLSVLIQADSWAWATTCKFKADENPQSAGFLTGGFSPSQFAKFQEALEHPDTAMLNSSLTREFEKKPCHLTRLRDQMDVEQNFVKSAVHHIWIAAGVEQVIMSVRPAGERFLSTVAVYRRPGRIPFTLRESRIVHIVLSEVPWLHESILSSSIGTQVSRLTPRQRITLNLLLEGQTRKQISEHLELSPHTIDGYVKEVFRFFNVHSQPALIARFQNGDGGDIP